MAVIYTQEPGRSAQQVNSEHPLPVTLIAASDGTLATPVQVNLTLTSADTEYVQDIPPDCYLFEWQCRTAAAVRWAPIVGKVATPTAPYKTLKAGDYYVSPQFDDRHKAPPRIFFASATAAVVVELTVWK